MKNYIQYIVISIVIICIIAFYYYNPNNPNTNKEHFRNIIWSNRAKMYQDYYPRSNGSIYGNCIQPWDMFSGFPVYPKAY